MPFTRQSEYMVPRDSCPLCGAVVPIAGARFVVRQFDKDVRMVECPECGLAYKDHRPSEECLRAIYDIRCLALCLKPQGEIYFDVPNADSWIARKCGANWGSALLIEHLTFWTPKALAFLAGQAGCRVLQVKRSGIPYPLGRRSADERSFGVPLVQTGPVSPASEKGGPSAFKQRSQRLLYLCRKLKAHPLFGRIARVMLDVSGLGDQFTVVLAKR